MDQFINSGSMPWQPNFSVSAEGNDITDEIRNNLVNMTITDFGGAEKKSDQVTLTIVSETLELPKKGAKLTVGIGFGQELISKGTYVVDSTSSAGSSDVPRTIGIVGRAFSKSNAYGHSTVQSQRIRSFSDITMGDLVNKIATEHELTPRVPEELASKVIAHVDQAGESDMNLLTRLAEQYGAVSKISHDYWIVSPREAVTNISGDELQKLKVTRAMTSDWSYHNNSDHPDSSASGSGTQIYQYFDVTDGGKIKSFTIGSGQPVTTSAPFASLALAQESAGGGSIKSKKKLRGMSVSLPAEPEMMGLTAQCLITTSGFGTVEDGDWHISKLDLVLGSQGFTIKMDLE
ncbi:MULTISPECIES: contractile injection system protein, VgrG/Pvc8 family [Citrobacter]|jgi:phage protein D|uniref:contractile injection system protein, VgrG/Pvc8 family n=1 Tax=Citrobacter TaxID=544 RepID=UPI0014613159|nr:MULTISPECIES: contractile injection system protein, VgrG/Pvc8 family [Citrobacter]MBJ9525002.1 late control protein [Citrobacter braakii]NMR49141.1 late control protein [Citrobacter braakii]WEA77542.1 contractile injection system protein, VgrG/Pvc8 family [Citrobacter braakii]WFV30230.1 contractile injection system protein, VgrG/Pvc8 family [Citrobacter braakii]